MTTTDSGLTGMQSPVTDSDTWPRLGVVKVSQTAWMAPSAKTAPGAYWLVEWFPGNRLTCSCPHGEHTANHDSSARPCRHMRLVLAAERANDAKRPTFAPNVAGLVD